MLCECMTGTTSNDRPHRPSPAIRTIAMPADANANGDIFGGWMMAQMDLAGGVAAIQRAQGRVVDRGRGRHDLPPAGHVGDLVSCYSEVTRVGRTSLTVKVEAWVQRRIGRHIGTGDQRLFHLCRRRRKGPATTGAAGEHNEIVLVMFRLNFRLSRG